MIFWEFGKTDMKRTVTFWAVLGLQGYHTVLLVEWFPIFQRNIVCLKRKEQLFPNYAVSCVIQ